MAPCQSCSNEATLREAAPSTLAFCSLECQQEHYIGAANPLRAVKRFFSKEKKEERPQDWEEARHVQSVAIYIVALARSCSALACSQAFSRVATTLATLLPKDNDGNMVIRLLTDMPTIVRQVEDAKYGGVIKQDNDIQANYDLRAAVMPWRPLSVDEAKREFLNRQASLNKDSIDVGILRTALLQLVSKERSPEHAKQNLASHLRELARRIILASAVLIKVNSAEWKELTRLLNTIRTTFGKNKLAVQDDELLSAELRDDTILTLDDYDKDPLSWLREQLRYHEEQTVKLRREIESLEAP
jgi:hypothetical protein